ncbi:hypothetical protein RRSWK_03214 [Rhodopirellula sp. SWK7]|nr:hypothetical protein RRSWK_03214 [Rhodopirellula sp. SWK7]
MVVLLRRLLIRAIAFEENIKTSRQSLGVFDMSLPKNRLRGNDILFSEW